MPQPTPQPTWWEALVASLYGVLGTIIRGLGKLLGFVVIVVIGWLISSLVAKAVTAILRGVHFSDLANKMGLSGFAARMGVKSDPAQLVGDLVKWLIRIIVLLTAFTVLGIPAFSTVLSQLLLWLPNLAVALAVLIVGGLAANAVANLVRGATSEGGFKNPDVLANVASGAIWAFAIVIAVNQVGIASTLVNTLFMGFVGALSLACGLAFGLGGRDLAGTLLEKWYGKAKSAMPKAEAAANAAQRRTREE